MLRAYRYRLYPSEDQKVMLAKHFGSCRFVWNHYLDLNNRRYAETGKGTSFKQMCKELTLLKKEDEYLWLKDVNSQSLQPSLLHLETAYRRFFNKLGEEPVFKGKHKRKSFTVTQRFRVEDNRLGIPNFKESIKMFRHRDFNGQVRSITISQEPSGKYHASILVYEQDPDIQQMPVTEESAIGIDMGIKTFATLSDGVQIQKPKHFVQSEKKLVKAQKRLSRKKKGSHNRMKQRVRVARIQEHMANQRRDFLNRVSDILTRTYDTITVEDLSLKDMMNGNHRRAKAVADAGCECGHQYQKIRTDFGRSTHGEWGINACGQTHLCSGTSRKGRNQGKCAGRSRKPTALVVGGFHMIEPGALLRIYILYSSQ